MAKLLQVLNVRPRNKQRDGGPCRSHHPAYVSRDRLIARALSFRITGYTESTVGRWLCCRLCAACVPICWLQWTVLALLSVWWKCGVWAVSKYCLCAVCGPNRVSCGGKLPAKTVLAEFGYPRACYLDRVSLSTSYSYYWPEWVHGLQPTRHTAVVRTRTTPVLAKTIATIPTLRWSPLRWTRTNLWSF